MALNVKECVQLMREYDAYARKYRVITSELYDRDYSKAFMDTIVCCERYDDGWRHSPKCPAYKHFGNKITTVQCSNQENKLMKDKQTNPKDAVGVAKVPMSCVPAGVMAELGLAMMEGARKYGRHNYRISGVRASVYYDAAFRHLISWYEGQDIDPDSGLSHIAKAIASLTVLRDAMMNDMWTDDRPPSMKDQEWISKFNNKAKDIITKYPEAKEPFVRKQ